MLDIEHEFEIQILFKDAIKVFYKRVQDALNDGYSNFDRNDFSNHNGYLYSFTGLRGDAKELYRSIVQGREKRVQLIEAKTANAQAPYINKADIVIWSCGYKTNPIPIYDMSSCQNMKFAKPLELSCRQSGTQFDVDNKCRIIL